MYDDHSTWKGTIMKRSIYDLRPTQFALGMREVEAKVKRLKNLKDKELHEYLHEHPVPVVICKDGNAHVIDHHHLVRACWEIGIENIATDIVEDLSAHPHVSFWEKMKRSNWVHLFDQFGHGPHDHTLLPLDIRGLADDTYRSIAWAVREAGGFEKSPEPFTEFKWADFFRKTVPVERTPEGFEKAVEAALKLAHTESAKHLPGYLAKKTEPQEK